MSDSLSSSLNTPISSIQNAYSTEELEKENPIGIVAKNIPCASFPVEYEEMCFLHMFLFHYVIYNLIILHMKYEQKEGCGEQRRVYNAFLRCDWSDGGGSAAWCISGRGAMT